MFKPLLSVFPCAGPRPAHKDANHDFKATCGLFGLGVIFGTTYAYIKSGEHKARRWKPRKGQTKVWIMVHISQHHQDAGPRKATHRLENAWSSTPAARTMAQFPPPDTKANWLTLPCTRATAGFHRSPQSHGSRAIRLTAWGSARSLLPNLPNRQAPPSSAPASSQTPA